MKVYVVVLTDKRNQQWRVNIPFFTADAAADYILRNCWKGYKSVTTIEADAMTKYILGVGHFPIDNIPVC